MLFLLTFGQIGNWWNRQGNAKTQIFTFWKSEAKINFLHTKKCNTWKSWQHKTSPNLNCGSKYLTKKSTAKNTNHLHVNTTLIMDFPRTVRNSINMISEATTANFSLSKSFRTVYITEWIQITLRCYIKTLPIIIYLWRNKVVESGVTIFTEIRHWRRIFFISPIIFPVFFHHFPRLISQTSAHFSTPFDFITKLSCLRVKNKKWCVSGSKT